MNERATVILPQTQEILSRMGEQIRLTRLRRHLSTEPVAERVGTVWIRICSWLPRMTSEAKYRRIWSCLPVAVHPREVTDYAKDRLCV